MLKRAAAWIWGEGTCWLFCLAASALSSGRAAEKEERVEEGCFRSEYRVDTERE